MWSEVCGVKCVEWWTNIYHYVMHAFPLVQCIYCNRFAHGRIHASSTSLSQYSFFYIMHTCNALFQIVPISHLNQFLFDSVVANTWQPWIFEAN